MLIDSLIHSSTQEEIPRPCAWVPEGKGSKAIQRCFWLADKIKSNGKVKLKKKKIKETKRHIISTEFPQKSCKGSTLEREARKQFLSHNNTHNSTTILSTYFQLLPSRVTEFTTPAVQNSARQAGTPLGSESRLGWGQKKTKTETKEMEWM